jgi:hypothetical protein
MFCSCAIRINNKSRSCVNRNPLGDFCNKSCAAAEDDEGFPSTRDKLKLVKESHSSKRLRRWNREHSEGAVSDLGSSHLICKCMSKTLIKTASTTKNHGKRFYACVNYTVKCVWQFNLNRNIIFPSMHFTIGLNPNLCDYAEWKKSLL